MRLVLADRPGSCRRHSPIPAGQVRGRSKGTLVRHLLATRPDLLVLQEPPARCDAPRLGAPDGVAGCGAAALRPGTRHGSAPPSTGTSSRRSSAAWTGAPSDGSSRRRSRRRGSSTSTSASARSAPARHGCTTRRAAGVARSLRTRAGGSRPPGQPARDPGPGHRQLRRVPRRRGAGGQRPRNRAGDRPLLRRPRRRRRLERRAASPKRVRRGRFFVPGRRPRRGLLEEDAAWSLGFRVDGGRRRLRPRGHRRLLGLRPPPPRRRSATATSPARSAATSAPRPARRWNRSSRGCERPRG